MSGSGPPKKPYELNDNQVAALRYRAKGELRKRLRAVRRAVPAQSRSERSQRACEYVTGLPEWANAKVIAGYVAMGSEADPQPALDAAMASGKTIALPAMDWDQDEVILRQHTAGVALEESGLGFEQPAPNAALIANDAVDLIVVPALAIDDRGFRLGWGKGYYDRLLPRLRRALSVGLIFDFQRMAELPNTPGDVAVAITACDQRITRNP